MITLKELIVKYNINLDARTSMEIWKALGQEKITTEPQTFIVNNKEYYFLKCLSETQGFFSAIFSSEFCHLFVINDPNAYFKKDNFYLVSAKSFHKETSIYCDYRKSDSIYPDEFIELDI